MATLGSLLSIFLASKSVNYFWGSVKDGERLIDFEQDTLRFMTDAKVPFTNNQGENDIRMTKLHQKISGCFRTMEGANIFCRVRCYLSTCRKNNVSATEALTMLFEGRLPDFIL